MNKKHKGLFIGILLSVITLVTFGSTFFIYTNSKQEKDVNAKLQIVTSFYPMYIACLNITEGVEGIHLENLSEPQTGCLHDYQLRTQDMRLLSGADVFVVNGGGIESFLSEVAGSYPELAIVNASEGLLIEEDEASEEHDGASEEHDEANEEHDNHHHHGENAHVWMSVAMHKKQVVKITEELCLLDAEHAEQYQANAKRYLEQLDNLEQEIDKLKEDTTGENVILFHEAYEYLADDLDMPVAFVLDLDEQRQVSAGEVAQVLDAIETKQVSLIFAEEAYGKEMGDMVEAQTNVQVVYLDTLVRGDYAIDSYLTHMQANLDQIYQVMSQ